MERSGQRPAPADRVDRIADRARVRIVEHELQLAQLGAGVELAPLGHLAGQNARKVLQRNDRIGILAVDDQRDRIARDLELFRKELLLLQTGLLGIGQPPRRNGQPDAVFQQQIDRIDLARIDRIDSGHRVYAFENIDLLLNDPPEAFVGADRNEARGGRIRILVLRLTAATR